MNTKTTIVTVVALALIGLASPATALVDLETKGENSTTIQYVGGTSDGDGSPSPVATGLQACAEGIGVGGCTVACDDCTITLQDDINGAQDFNYRCSGDSGPSTSSQGGEAEIEQCNGGSVSLWIHLGATTGTISVVED